jgi:HipA-like protein
MKNRIKSILNSFKKSTDEKKSSNRFIAITNVKFTLSYKSLKIGYLEFSPNDDSWIFLYSEEFKNQNFVAPILSFPDTNKVYEGKELWSFFSSRIPDNVGSSSNDIKVNQENKTLIDLLRSYGKKTITNPYDLSLG